MPGPAGDAAHDPAGGVTVEPAAVGAEEDRSFAAFADGEVDGPGGAGRERDGDDLAALAQDGQGAVAALEAEAFDVGAGRFGDPQPVEGEQADRARGRGRRPSPAATSIAPTSLRSRPVAWDS